LKAKGEHHEKSGPWRSNDQEGQDPGGDPNSQIQIFGWIKVYQYFFCIIRQLHLVFLSPLILIPLIPTNPS